MPSKKCPTRLWRIMKTNAVTYDYTTEYDLHTAGTTWFSVDSLAEYGYGKAYPAGEYRAIVTAECIAN